MPSDRVVQLCASPDTIATLLAKEPSSTVQKVAKEFSKTQASSSYVARAANEDDLEQVVRCGKFPSRPSDLFLKMYRDVLTTLDKDPLAGITAPSLLGTSGVVPLSIISVIPDIMRHYADLIVNAKTEILLATNYWERSHSSGLLSDALRELSTRIQRRKGKRIVVKIMYDRGTPSQFFKNHAPVKAEEWEKLLLPHPEEMPCIDLEVINFHRPPLGTFHSKYLIVDRRIACLNSNNVQDRPNVEMMIHVEGPIVESFYDMALLSWNNMLEPPLPLLGKSMSYEDDHEYKFGEENPALAYIDPEAASKASQILLHAQNEESKRLADLPRERTSITAEVIRKGTGFSDEDGEFGQDPLVLWHPAMRVPRFGRENGDADEEEQLVTPILADGLTEEPMNPPVSPSPSDRKSSISGHSAKSGKSYKSLRSRAAEIAEHLNAGKQETEATIDDDALSLMADFRPHILHAPHKAVPMAMVNRKPRGTPGHTDALKVPQDVAWLGAFKYAKKSIFIQTPTFNASPVVAACLDACKRDIEVTLYLDLGFNDLGETIPFQGGTNQSVVSGMYEKLHAVAKHANLKVYWYTGKDQTRPMNAAEKKRNCHVKFLSVDDQVAIIGNGNQDTQSWFHSQEINVMIDSKELVTEWHHGLNANQNTQLYGEVSHEDGIWRDENGNGIDKPQVTSGGPLGKLRALGRLRGTAGP